MSKTSNFFKTSAILSTALLSLLGACAIDDPIDYTTSLESPSNNEPNSEVDTQTLDLSNGSIKGEFPEYSVNNITDTSAFSVIHTTPKNNSNNVARKSTVFIYFSDEINPDTVSDESFEIYENDKRIYGIYGGMLSTSKNTILSLSNVVEFAENAEVKIIINEKMKDNDGNSITGGKYEMTFQVTSEEIEPFKGETGFENIVASNILFNGNAGIVESSQIPNVEAPEGDKMFAISTFDSGNDISSTGAISGSTSSAVMEFEIPNGATHVEFSYNFLSAEFDTYVGSTFDDTFTLTLSSIGKAPKVIQMATVNLVGVSDSTGSVPFVETLQQTGFQTNNNSSCSKCVSPKIDITNFQSPITLEFSVSDVGDTGVSSLVLVDNVSFSSNQ